MFIGETCCDNEDYDEKHIGNSILFWGKEQEYVFVG